MTITRTIPGSWWNQGARPILKTEGAVSQDVGTCEIATCAIVTEKYADNSVTSEKASASMRHNTISFVVPAPSSSEAAGVATLESTGNAVWRPRVNVNVLQITGFALELYENATCDMFVLYGNAGTSVGQISLKAVAASTALARGTRTAGSAINQAALAAGTDLFVQQVTSTCSTPRPYLIQVDYETTG